MSYRTDFIQTILDASDSDNWASAVEEWEVVGYIDDPSGTESCICGQENLRYVYTISNVLNGNCIANIGSKCVKKFHNEGMDYEVRCWKKTNELIEEAAKAKDILKVPFGAPYYSRDLLRFFYEHGVFKPSAYNEGGPFNDYQFMVDMFNMRSDPSRGQVCKLRALIRNDIRPFLGEVWSNSRKVG